MNEDIKILREALAKYALYVEGDGSDPMGIPHVLYRETKEQFREACDPDRIRRLLDDAERYQIWRDAYTSENPEQPATERILLNMANAWTAGDVDYFLGQARKA